MGLIGCNCWIRFNNFKGLKELNMKRFGFAGIGGDYYQEISSLYSRIEEIPSTQYTIDREGDNIGESIVSKATSIPASIISAVSSGEPIVTGAVAGPMGQINLSTMPTWGWITIGILILMAMRR